MQSNADLPLHSLGRTFERVVDVLDAAGATGFVDLYLTLSAVRDDAVFGELSLARDLICLRRTPDEVALPTYVYDGDEANERALLFANLCYVMWYWDLEPREVAQFLGCPCAFIEEIVADGAVGEVPTLSPRMALRIRRLLMVDTARLLAGVSNDSVAQWMRAPREEFASSTPLDMVLSGDDTDWLHLTGSLLDGAAIAGRTVQ